MLVSRVGRARNRGPRYRFKRPPAIRSLKVSRSRGCRHSCDASKHRDLSGRDCRRQLGLVFRRRPSSPQPLAGRLGDRVDWWLPPC